MTDYGSPAFARLREEAGDAWGAYTRHAFVEQMRDGSLPQASFLHYLRQDYVFLFHFSRAWALGVVKASTVEEARFAAALVDGLLNTELKLHIDICAKAGIGEAELLATPEAQENLAYTRFVIDSGVTGDFLDLVVALAPCVLGYGEIGARLASEAAPDTPYREWVETYACDVYQGHCEKVGHLLEAAVSSRLGETPSAVPRWAALSRRFTMATQLEIGFWNMGLRGHV